jgi:hypothetical protein
MQTILSKPLDIKFDGNSSSNIVTFICGDSSTDKTNLTGVFCCEGLILGFKILLNILKKTRLKIT